MTVYRQKRKTEEKTYIDSEIADVPELLEEFGDAWIKLGFRLAVVQEGPEFLQPVEMAALVVP